MTIGRRDSSEDKPSPYPSPGVPGEGTRAFWICSALCAIYAIVTWTAVSGKSATIDEPSHAVTGWFDFYVGDYRLSPDVPPLWEDWIALGVGRNGLHFDATSEAYRSIRIRRDLTAWDVRTMYQTPGNDGAAVVWWARLMALPIGVGLAALIGWWAWKLGGAVAAAGAMVVYCLDPNFIGHGALVKNDVPITLAYLLAAYALWRCGSEFTWWTAAGVVVAICIAIGVKFSGVLMGPVMVVVLGYRALEERPWRILGREVSGRGRKLMAAGALGVVTCAVIYLSIWISYGFRFDAGPDGLSLDSTRFVGVLRDVQAFTANHNHPPTPEQLAAWEPGLLTRFMLAAEQHHWLPQAWIDGFIMTQSGSESRLCYLAGMFYNGGKWYYFPMAAFFKAPLATIVAVVLAAWIGLGVGRSGLLRDGERRWNALALAVPGAVYAMVAITSNVNIGLRHAFPVYPFVFIAIGLAAARVWVYRPARIVMGVLALGLATETAAAYPNYIDFFGIACGGSSAGFKWLSDSNLDWGQDLPLLAEWQKSHAETPLYLDYFGRCDPAAYGIQYFNLPGGYEYGPKVTEPRGACEIAVSSTHLRLLYAYDQPPGWFALIRGREPEKVLGGSIYLFRVDKK